MFAFQCVCEHVRLFTVQKTDQCVLRLPFPKQAETQLDDTNKEEKAKGGREVKGKGIMSGGEKRRGKREKKRGEEIQ